MNDPYADAVLYDLEYADHREDLTFYTERARASPGRVLELGCGTGRLLLPMARVGATVVGVDRAEAMLVELRRKLADEPLPVQSRVTALEGDYLAEDGLPDGPFGLVLWPFNALHHCPDELALQRVLTRLAARVGPNGRLALDCYLPDRELYDRDPNGRYEHRIFTHPVTGERLLSWEQGWWDEPTKTHHVLYVYRHPDGAERRTHLQLRMFALDEVRTALAAAGWRLLREWRDFRGGSLEPGSLKWVGLAERSR